LQNLAAVLAYVNPEQPLASPFLTSAVSLHSSSGVMTQPPLKGRESPAYRALEEWVRTTLETNPQLRSRPTGPAAPSAPVPPMAAQPAGAGKAAATSQKATEPPNTELKAPAAPPTAFAATKAADPMKSYADPVDAFDPVIFNRQMHP